MTPSFFSRIANVAIGAALAVALMYAVVSIGPIAFDRWF
jgi:hypothetical protein